ncbi:fructosamine kinase family protein [Alkalilimnicola sp. S0819]|uniref:fructosamine kinase family protein n=1 Tax=Alkalilimnicola sp. S0819 TaxID=2613922 RepID=UPI00126260C8|nr:fructosamine kinase family protein [Alkalilimnicola sp. S0819]KAB7623974.1 fructosamine kinase family protein [Alkalilimnicola sp. S0819]MPQ16576.1 phosphotransferase [Alkalilimnicola sp. S0819]
MDLWTHLSQRLADEARQRVEPHAERRGGGCINGAAVLGRAPVRYFVKYNRAARLSMFEAEAAGLRELARAARVPRPICSGVFADQAYLLLEYIDFGPGSTAAYRRLGEALARLHSVEGPYYGWTRDNTIGSTPQPNPPSEDWWGFFGEHRLGHQLRLVARNGYGGAWLKAGERLAARLHRLFPGPAPRPALLHGDLWAGNVGFDACGNPVLFDPACHYGDPCSDLAMSELFGGFPAAFYASYQARSPLPEDYPRRRDLYQLYHVLNHLNLFGGAYLGQARRLMERLLAAMA